jgi:hypothetical protein
MAQKSETVTRIIRHLGPPLAYETLENGIQQLARRIDISNAPRLIGFCGAAGAGKDTASFLLSLLGYQKIAFADALKIEAYDLIVNPTEEYRTRVKEELGINLPLSLDIAEADFEKVDIINRRKVELRRLLQWHGTEFRRAQDKDYWINKVREKVRKGFWAVSDVRFQNEVSMTTHRPMPAKRTGRTRSSTRSSTMPVPSPPFKPRSTTVFLNRKPAVPAYEQTPDLFGRSHRGTVIRRFDGMARISQELFG